MPKGNIYHNRYLCPASRGPVPGFRVPVPAKKDSLLFNRLSSERLNSVSDLVVGAENIFDLVGNHVLNCLTRWSKVFTRIKFLRVL